MNQKLTDIDMIPVSASVLSDLIGVGDRRIRQLADEGVIVRIKKGRYDLAASMKNYIKYLKVSEGLQDSPKNEQEELDHEKMLHEKAKRGMAELKLAAMRGEMHKAEDVERVMTDQLSAFRSKVLNIPTKIAAPLSVMTDKGMIMSFLENEMVEALNEVTVYSSTLFYSDEYVDIESEVESIEGSEKA